MARISSPLVPIPKNIQVRIPSSLSVLSAIVDSDDNTLVLNTSDGVTKIDLSSMINNPMGNTKQKRQSVSSLMINSIKDMVDADFNCVEKTVREYKPTCNREAIENRFILSNELFEAVDFSNMGVVEESKDAMPKFIVGEKYSLKGVSCEGFEMPEKVYELVAVHDKFDDIDINSLIVKQISGDQDKIFTLSKNDCAHIGIEYENGLQLFPKHLNWKRVKEIVPFDPSNLATSPLSDIDNTVRYILLKLNGFKDYTDGYVVTPSGKLIKEEQFGKTLRIISNEPIVYSNPTNKAHGIRIDENKPLKVKVVYPKTTEYKHGNFISSDDTVYVLIDLTISVDLADTIDYKLGVAKPFLEGFNPNSHFQISWDELGAYTIEEYEAEKARKEKARQERIAKEEAARLKRIAEEEKRIKEQRKRTEEAVERMKNFNIKLPNFPKMVDFNMENGLSSLNLYMDGLDIYFDTLDTSLTKLSKDLSQMSREIGINIDKRMSKNLSNSTLFDMFKL